jgi:uncharacterized membrane protein YsdA (DUF1294 family)/cold shock CspA family protein
MIICIVYYRAGNLGRMSLEQASTICALKHRSGVYLRLIELNQSIMNSKSPRDQGKISIWKDEQGYGFITPNGDGPTVFIHVKSFARQGIRPVGNEIVTYELVVNEKGQHRAENVAYVRNRSAPEPTHGTGARSLVVAVVFLGFIATCSLTGKLPALVLGLYLVMSVAAFIAYALDKSAAQENRWRTKESTLHMLGLAGGWPGALFAQQVFRHKHRKQSFRQVFWFTVIMNCGALGWLLSPFGLSARQIILGTA